MTDNNRIILCNNRHHPSEADLCDRSNNDTERAEPAFYDNSKDK